MTDMNIGKYWVGGSYNPKVFSVDNNERLVYTIVFGYINEILKDSIIRTFIKSNRRKLIEERIITDKELTENIRNRMEAVRLAPSAINK